MRVEIDTATKTAWLDGKEYALTEKQMSMIKTGADLMEEHLGTKEYEGIVADIQRWYYGRLVKAAWCATSVSYFLDKAGVGKQTGRFESCTRMLESFKKRGYLDATAFYGGGAYSPKRGDIVFLSWKCKFDPDHVGFISSINKDTGELVVTSGNSSDMIKQDSYNYFKDKRVIAFGRVDYGK